MSARVALRVALVLFVGCGAPPPAEEARSAASPPAPAALSPEGAPVHSDRAAADDPAVGEFAQRYVDLLVELSPESATALGLHAREGELDDRTAEGVARAVQRQEGLLRELDARFATARLSPAARTDLALVRSALKVDVLRRTALRPHVRRPEHYTEPLHAIHLMIAREEPLSPERARAALARVEKLPGVFVAAKANLDAPSRVLVEVGIESARGAPAFLDEVRVALERALPADKARVVAGVRAAKRAFSDYEAWLKRSLLPRAKGDFAAGKEVFEALLREDYFVTDDADALHALGKRVFADTLQKLSETARRIDPAAASWSDVVARVRANHPSAEDLLPSYRREVERARRFLVEKDVVPFPPGDELAVVETPTFQRSTIEAAYDQPPPFDAGVTKGLFYVTPVEPAWSAARKEEWLREHDHGDQVDTVVHEAYPGHHLQLSFARLHPSPARKAVSSDVFSEGWGLYSEELMAELGYYTDEERLMQLVWTLVRAARVIIDVGLHTRGMTYEQAVTILTDEVHLEKQLARNEVKRYAGSPTQPLSYLVGRERILALRERVRAAEGPRFSLKAFHAELLTRGTIPPDLLARELPSLAGR